MQLDASLPTAATKLTTKLTTKLALSGESLLCRAAESALARQFSHPGSKKRRKDADGKPKSVSHTITHGI